MVRFIWIFFVVMYWRNVAYQISISEKFQGQDCKVKVFQLTRRMDSDRVEYTIVHGFYNKIPHRWVELFNKVIDPSISNPNYHLYKEGGL